MRTLAIETASEACSVALFDGDHLVSHRHEVLGRGHAERLVPMIEELPDRGEASRILVSLGPGSFTGVRIGLAVARALAIVWRARVSGYPTLSLLATMAQRLGEEPVTVCVNGGHGQWFVQDFGPQGRPLNGLVSLTPDEARDRTHQRIAVGNRASDLLTDGHAGYKALDLRPDARAAVLLPPEMLLDTLIPLYGRQPDARLPG
ncbi:tRNA (adenosine(37)-N6)-threonylcarbamoyltransferase complex dimerization subunit type 1 TsaB [Qipengyuania sp.]|uniref:tRNA (adenosine(37)-N6)-threonylcarbamoyltransferase complex dimerization subunit type 1 TsaB n=1 Tax=Qipengyuania sp. TaxID=2004515 RepID=UPI003736F1E4